MRGVQFGEYHTATDWNLILNSKNIDPPTPKVVKVSVDGRDGDLNLSRALSGDMKFNNREASFTFLVTGGSYESREALINEIINAVHGQELQIIEPDDEDHFLVGECSVKSVVNNKAYGSFTVTADCEPYRYLVDDINRVIILTTTPTDIVLHNIGRKTLTPTITVEGEVNLKFGSSNVGLSTGSYKLSALHLKTGPNIVTVSGSGTITFTYREAVL